MRTGSPVDAHVSMLGMIRCGFLKLPFRFGFGRFLRFAGANDQMDKIHKRVVDGPHWFLMGIGVRAR